MTSYAAGITTWLDGSVTGPNGGPPPGAALGSKKAAQAHASSGLIS
jgi:hypothetical protein